MENDWKPPPIEQFTGGWKVDPALAREYARYSSRSSAVLNAVALVLLHDRFKPFGRSQASRYFAATKRDPDQDVRLRVFREMERLPVGFRQRLAREIVRECLRLVRELDGLEAEAHPSGGAKLWLDAWFLLEQAKTLLAVHGLDQRVVRVLRYTQSRWDSRATHASTT